MTQHQATVWEPPAWRIDGKWAAQCAQCGWFGGFRWATKESAERGCERHNRDAAKADRDAHQKMYGPRR